jgi:hypothetical protein
MIFNDYKTLFYSSDWKIIFLFRKLILPLGFLALQSQVKPSARKFLYITKM